MVLSVNCSVLNQTDQLEPISGIDADAKWRSTELRGFLLRLLLFVVLQASATAWSHTTLSWNRSVFGSFFCPILIVAEVLARLYIALATARQKTEYRSCKYILASTIGATAHEQYLEDEESVDIQAIPPQFAHIKARTRGVIWVVTFSAAILLDCVFLMHLLKYSIRFFVIIDDPPDAKQQRRGAATVQDLKDAVVALSGAAYLTCCVIDLVLNWQWTYKPKANSDLEQRRQETKDRVLRLTIPISVLVLTCMALPWLLDLYVTIIAFLVLLLTLAFLLMLLILLSMFLLGPVAWVVLKLTYLVLLIKGSHRLSKAAGSRNSIFALAPYTILWFLSGLFFMCLTYSEASVKHVDCDLTKWKDGLPWWIL